MSNLATEENDADQNLSSNENKKSKCASTMLLYLRELFFLFALVFTSYTALFNSLPKIGKAPTPIPFFPRGSIVADFYKGTVNDAFQRASEVDLAVVMYYAPWDAESQKARHEFEIAAKFFEDEVYFTAISCWSPHSECKQHVPKIKYFPVIVAYPQHIKGIQYQGPINSVAIINFVKTVMRPLRRILALSDIINLASEYNVFVVGSFLFNGNLGSVGYYTFYSTALKMLEKDPYCELAFAVTTDSKIAAELDFESLPSVRLYLWNETYDYPSDADYTEDSLVKWIREKMHQVAQWVSPPIFKSKLLSSHITQGPALILFTPRNSLFGINPLYNMLREVAFRYNNCNNNMWVAHLSNCIEMKNRNLQYSRQKLEKYCLKRKQRRDLYKSSIFTNAVVMPDLLLNRTKNLDSDICDMGGLSAQYFGPQSEVCFKKSREGILYGATSLRHTRRSEGIFLKNEFDEKSPENLLDYSEDEKCKTLEMANSYYKLPFPKISKEDTNDTIDGLACVNNRTLSIIALDSLFHYQFAEALGINILHIKDRTTVVIVNKEEDSQYFMDEPINKNNLISFIVKHTKGELNRFLRSSHDAALRSITGHRYPVRRAENCEHTDTEACVPELHSRNFLHFISNQNWAAIVFYHTPYCALCRSISHVFLLLSRYFRHFPALKFARIDGDSNDLPWEYTMDLFPAILFFPTIRKSETRLYNNDLPFTIKNLIHFVLANLEPEAKIPAMVSLCISFEKLQTEEEAIKCKSKIQKECLNNLSKTLRDVRRNMNLWKNLPANSAEHVSEILKRKKILFFKLEYFKTNHFLLGSVDRIKENSAVVKDIIKLYFKLMKTIRNNSYSSNYEVIR